MVASHYYLALDCNRKTLSPGDMTEEERANILNRAGLRWKMTSALAQLWQTSDKTIEVGATVLTKTGAIMHIVHLMRRDAVAVFAEELFGDQRDGLETALDVARRFYEIRRAELS